MIRLSDEIASTRAERSLLIAYCANPSHIEMGLLRPLQEHGEGRVTVIVDSSRYADAFSEVGVRGLGVHYRYYGARMPKPGVAFHAKLYLMSSANAATLIVASANLNNRGFHRNAEVFDRLSIARANDGTLTGDVGAFREYLRLLDALADGGLGITLAEGAREAVTAEVRHVRCILGAVEPVDGTRWPKFLHSGFTPLLEQIRGHVPADAVTKLTVISPFYDEGNAGVLGLLRAYPKAKVSIIKNQDAWNNFHGPSLSHHVKRIVLEHVGSVSGEERYLHAKMYLLSGPRGMWLIVGSANATAPAWLRTVTGAIAGNLEAITLRFFTDKRLRAELLEPLDDRQPVEDWVEQPYEMPPDALAAGPNGDEAAAIDDEMPLLDAEVRHNAIRVRAVDGAWARNIVSATIVLEDRLARTSFPATLTREGKGEVLIVAGAGNTALDRREPAIVIVHAVNDDGVVLRGRAWLMRPTMLDATAAQRRVEYAVEDFAATPYQRASQYEVLLTALIEMAEEDFGRKLQDMAEPRSDSDRGESADSKTTEQEDRARSLGASELISQDSDHFAPAFLGQDSAQRSLFERGREMIDRMFMRPEVREEDDEETAGTKRAVKGGGTISTPGRRIPRLTSREFSSVTSLLYQFTSKLREGARDPGDVPFAVWRLEQAVCTVLPRLVLQAPDDEGENRARLIESLHAAWADALSVDGVAYGHPRGWMVRAWASPSLRATLEASLIETGRAARLVAAFAVSLAFMRAGGYAQALGGISMAGVVAGLRVITGVEDVFDHARWNAEVRDRIANYALHSDGLIADTAVVEAARAVAGEELTILREANRWWPLVAIEQARARGEQLASHEEALRLCDATLFEVYRKQGAKDSKRIRAVAMSLEQGRVVCHSCQSTQSVQHSNAIRAGASREPLCENCSRILIPFTFADPVTIAVLERLLPATRTTGDITDGSILGGTLELIA